MVSGKYTFYFWMRKKKMKTVKLITFYSCCNLFLSYNVMCGVCCCFWYYVRCVVFFKIKTWGPQLEYYKLYYYNNNNTLFKKHVFRSFFLECSKEPISHKTIVFFFFVNHFHIFTVSKNHPNFSCHSLKYADFSRGGNL